MFLRIPSALLTIAALALFCTTLPAQDSKTITIRILDPHTGKLITASNINVRINHLKPEHPEWVVVNEDGTAKATLPPDVIEIALHATYDNTMEVYVNCDAVKGRDVGPDHWYTLSAILASGLSAPNGCSAKTAVAKPGEFVLFARKKNWQDRYKQDFSE
jgi:hypothetical protein